MIRMSLAVLLGLLALSGAHAANGHRQIGEVDAQRFSDAEYEALLESARHRGWIYPADQVESGHRRHFEEFRMRLLNHGYEIVPVGVAI